MTQRVTQSSDSLGRVARLTLKELRETLRDRRTIVTLVVMPLLVYPLLSLGFKQLLLVNLTKTDLRVWRIATETTEEADFLRPLLAAGELVLRKRPAGNGEPAAPEDGLPAFSSRSGSQHGPQNLDQDMPRFFTLTSGTLEEELAKGEIHLGIRGSKRPEAPNDSYRDYELVYLADSAVGPPLADYVIERLRAANQIFTQERLRQLGDPGQLPATWRSRPLGGERHLHSQLATLVPMVLILMTITGAVYPAIDLTAGERERGTLEALMAAPVPRLGLLFGKYIAVLTVALLTALVNIVGMTVTVLSTGLGSDLFGEHGLTLGAVVLVFLLLVLFAAFFSAVLLCVTSFARSFKEAQAYLIPLMLVSLAPGFLTILPGMEKLNAWLAVAPLANIVLLARDTLQGNANPLWGFVAVLTTALYGTAALGLAARIFGSDSILYGSQSSWSDLVRRPEQPLAQPTLAGAMSCLALIVPLYVVASGSLLQLAGQSMQTQIIAGAVMLVVLFAVIPIAVARWQGVSVARGFQLQPAGVVALVGAAVLGVALAPLAYELFIVCLELGVATLSQQDILDKSPAVKSLLAQWRAQPPALVLAAIAFVPAVVEELFFRGYLLGSMRGRLPAWLAIAFTAMVFGLFHASVGGLILTERVLSSMAVGVALGWVCWTTRSVIPGMLLHAAVNGLVVGLGYWGEGLKSLGIDADGQQHLPGLWLVGAAVLAAIGAGLVYLGRRPAASTPLPAAPLAA